MIIRPFEMSCRVAYALASTVGSRIAGLVTMWPSLIVDVWSASRAITGIDSCHRTWESYVQPYWKPCASASFVSSIRRWYGGSGRTVTPNSSNGKPPGVAIGRESVILPRIPARGNVAVLPLRDRGGRDAPDSVRDQRAAGRLGREPAPRHPRLLRRRGGGAPRGDAALRPRPAGHGGARRGTLVGVARRLPRRVLRPRLGRDGAQTRGGRALRVHPRRTGARVARGRPFRLGRLRREPGHARPAARARPRRRRCRGGPLPLARG